MLIDVMQKEKRTNSESNKEMNNEIQGKWFGNHFKRPSKIF